MSSILVRTACSSKQLETKHRPGDGCDDTMIVLHDIEVFDLPDFDRDFSLRIQLVERCLVGPALIDCHRVRHLVVRHGLVEEAPDR